MFCVEIQSQVQLPENGELALRLVAVLSQKYFAVVLTVPVSQILMAFDFSAVSKATNEPPVRLHSYSELALLKPALVLVKALKQPVTPGMISYPCGQAFLRNRKFKWFTNLNELTQVQLTKLWISLLPC